MSGTSSLAFAAERGHFDAAVVGGGIAGLQTALDLADQGYQVLVVERASSIGGKMIALSKVFPTLDCASCITTPKMSAAAHHPNITLLTHTSVEAITLAPSPNGLTSASSKSSGPHRLTLSHAPLYVDDTLCIGCRQCEYECPVEYPDPFEEGLGAIRAIAVPFTNAIPQFAVLDPEYCIACGQCAKVCPTDAIKFDQEQTNLTIDADVVVLATGFKLNKPAEIKPQYAVKRSRNVLSPMAMERLLAPHGPFGRVVRPSDGKVPDNIAYVLCAGSRDETVGVSYCSRVCCMYSIKQAMLLSGSLPIADITIYYMDIRTFGKGYEQFYQTAKAMGINFVKGKVARMSEADGDNVILRVEHEEEGGEVRENRHDLVVMANGIVPDLDAPKDLGAERASDGFIRQPDPSRPAWTGRDGIFVAGTAAGPKDIVDSIVEAGAAAMEASQYLSLYCTAESAIAVSNSRTVSSAAGDSSET